MREPYMHALFHPAFQRKLCIFIDLTLDKIRKEKGGTTAITLSAHTYITPTEETPTNNTAFRT